MIEDLIQLERPFEANGYNGEGEEAFIFLPGTGPVLLSAPHAVNHFRKGEIKHADLFTGAIARYLNIRTGCPVICSAAYREGDPNFDQFDQNTYQQALIEYVKLQDIRVLLDLHGAGRAREYALEIGTSDAPAQESTIEGNQLAGEETTMAENPSLKEYRFLDELAEQTIAYFIAPCSTEKKEIWKNRIFAARGETRITRVVAERTKAACMQLEINRMYRDPAYPEEMEAMVHALECYIRILQEADWTKSPLELEKECFSGLRGVLRDGE
ncbi:MAG: hypothetical protein K6A92_03050 [Lachnospiraceae bacterium]|nr:hypothetical protein [Lachnospiraceae bacterium]